MERIDNSRFLLFIEPKKEFKSKLKINDEITKIVRQALLEAECGISNYSCLDEDEYFNGGLNEDGEIIHYYGIHETDCGRFSDCFDFRLKNGMITNSLCVFYLEHYRNYIPESEMSKVMKLVNFYKNINSNKNCNNS